MTPAGRQEIVQGFQRPRISFTTSQAPDGERALFRVKKALPEIVYDTAALEGNPMTFPEVQTLLEGITVGGHKVADAEQVLNQAASWKRLIERVSEGSFQPDKPTALELNGLVAKNEALEWGRFRTGKVSIAGTEHKPPPASELDKSFNEGMKNVAGIECIFACAMCAYLLMARQQFFWDGNKRTGRLLMNGILLSAGHDAICVPYTRRQEFNEKMLTFYNTGAPTEMLHFLASCSLDESLHPTSTTDFVS